MMCLQVSATTLCAAALALVACTPRSSAFAERPPSIEQIIDGLQRTEQLFFESGSLMLRYERTEAEDLVPSRASGGDLLAEWTLAYKDDKWFAERRFTEPRSTDRLLIPAEPKTQVVKSKLILEWEQDVATAFLNPFDFGGNVYSGLLYTGNLSLDAPKYIARSSGADIEEVRQQRGLKDYVALPFLPEFLRRNKEQYHVRAEPEEIEGVLCWVVEWPGMDRLCVDPQHGFAIRKRTYHWAPGKPLRVQIINRDYREVKPGLWLPYTQQVSRYASIFAEPESVWGKVTARMVYRVHSVEFDGVVDEFFEVRLPEGTRVVDQVRGLEYTVATSGGDPFGDQIDVARGLLDRREGISVWLIVINLAALLLVLGFLLWRWRRGVTNHSNP